MHRRLGFWNNKIQVDAELILVSAAGPKKAGVVMGCWLPPPEHRARLEQHEKPGEAARAGTGQCA